jgi:hypothetical protein
MGLRYLTYIYIYIYIFIIGMGGGDGGDSRRMGLRHAGSDLVGLLFPY